METVLKKIKGYLFHKRNPIDKLSIKQITKDNLPFFFGWVAMILWLDCYVLPVGSVGLGENTSQISPTSLFSYIYPISGAVFILLFNVRNLLPYLKISAPVFILGMLAVMMLKTSTITFIIITISAIGLGHIIASTGYGFFFVLNNAEKLYSVSIGILISKVILLLKVYSIAAGGESELFRIMQIIGFLPLLICTWIYSGSERKTPFNIETKMPAKNYTVLIILFLVFLFNDFIAPSVWRSIDTIPQLTLNIYHAIGVFIGIITVMLIQHLICGNICYAVNISFSVLTLGFVLNLFGAGRHGLLLSALLFGVSYSMGFVSVYYIIGIVLKKYHSLKFYRIGIVFGALVFVLGFSLTDSLEYAGTKSQLGFVLLSIIILLVVFSLTPFFTRTIYSAEWVDDLKRPDVTRGNRLDAHLLELKLSPREAEVCRLLLDGYTMRQISAILSITYATVNTYCTSIYRKLNINSRTELLIKFSDYLQK